MDITQRQLEILRATAKQIAKKGLSNLTTKSIAKKLRITEPSLYRHFKNKQHIIECLILWYEENLEDSFNYAQNRPTGLECILAYFEAREELYLRQPEIAQLSFNEELYYNDLGLGKKIQQLFINVQNFLLEMIARGQEDLSVRSDLTPEQIYYFVFGAHRVLVSECWFLRTKKEYQVKNQDLQATIKRFLTANI